MLWQRYWLVGRENGQVPKPKVFNFHWSRVANAHFVNILFASLGVLKIWSNDQSELIKATA